MSKPSRRRFMLAAGASLPAGLLAQPVKETAPSASTAAVIPPSDPRELPGRDQRLEIRTLDTPCTPHRYSTRAEWDERARKLREQILSAAGLWPLPERTPLRAHIFDKVEQDGFSVEKVYFESFPGFFCTGNLYRPLGGEHKPPFPGILNPHGHWNYGRLENAPGDLNGGAIPTRCMNFAFQGYVSFAYDMVGYNDSFQLPHRQYEDERAPWGMTADGQRLWLWGVSQLGLQLWNSIRALDFLASLPDVDPERLAMTGASGGGTQTFLTTAVDDRVKACAPVNMISHFMQGGCICENAPNLRIDTDNMEIGALAAPRPMQMISAAGDWTRDSERIEHPAIAAVYELLGARDHLSHNQFIYDHNYNRPSREAVYRFFARWLSKDPTKPAPERVEERGEFHIEPGRLMVFERRLPPDNAVTSEQLTAYRLRVCRDQLTQARPERAEQIEDFRKKFGPVYRAALMAEAPSPEDLRWGRAEGDTRPSANRQRLIIGRYSADDRIPATLVEPAGKAHSATLLVHSDGAEAALGSSSSPSPLVRELTRRGSRVLAIDAFQTGAARDAARTMKAGFFPTYNRTDDMQRVQDVLTALAYLEAVWRPEKISVVGQGLAGLWCLLARPYFKKEYTVAADSAEFDSAKDEDYLDKLHIPLLRRAGDFRTAALLAPASPLLLHNEQGELAAAYEEAYRLRGAGNRLRSSKEPLSVSGLAEWLLSA
ncbi:MAG: acetylxylan esterase [Terriglobia bacterium]